MAEIATAVEVLEPTKAQKEKIAAIIKHKGLIDEVVPSDMAPEDIISSLDTALSIFSHMDRQAGKTKLIIGRLLCLASEKPESYTNLGFEHFEDFIQDHVMVRFGISRPNIFECKKLYAAWGSAVNVEQYETIPITNLLYAAKFTDQTETGHKKVLELAISKPIVEFQQICEDKGWIRHDEAKGDVIHIKGSKAKIKELKKFLEDPVLQGKDEDGVQTDSAAGTDDPLGMILAAFAESSTEWLKPKRKSKAS